MFTLFFVNTDDADAAESVDVILNKRGDDPRLEISSRERNACKRYQCGLSSMTLASEKENFWRNTAESHLILPLRSIVTCPMKSFALKRS